MKLAATLVLLLVLASPVGAVTVWDESVQGDLSSDAANPTPITFSSELNTITGSVGNPGGVTDRDFITFTLPTDRIVSGLVLHGLSPDNLAFLAFNSGATSFVPGAATNGSFLAGIHASDADLDQNLMPFFVTRSVTTNALPSPFLFGPGTYCFVIQQTSPITQSYSLEFDVPFVLPVHPDTWGAVKALYR